MKVENFMKKLEHKLIKYNENSAFYNPADPSTKSLFNIGDDVIVCQDKNSLISLRSLRENNYECPYCNRRLSPDDLSIIGFTKASDKVTKEKDSNFNSPKRYSSLLLIVLGSIAFSTIILLLIGLFALNTFYPAGVTSTLPFLTNTSTNTPNPTFTPAATPNAEATAAAQSTQATGDVFAEVDELLSDSEIPYQEGHLLWQQTEPIEINMQGPSGDDSSVGINENLTGNNFIFKSDVTWEATGWMYCGAIFRSEPDIDEGRQYQFYFLRLSGLPVWYIDVFENNFFMNSISKEQQARVIDMTNGAVNQFVLIAQNEMFTVYFNGERQGRFFDNSKQLMEGYFGFFAWQESGTGSCIFNDSWIWSLDN